MLKEAFEFGKQAISLTSDMQKCKSDIKELQQDVKELREDFNQLRHEFTTLARVVERLVVEFEHERKDAARERELQQLRLEVILLRHERGLPPGSGPENPREPQDLISG